MNSAGNNRISPSRVSGSRAKISASSFLGDERSRVFE